MTRRCFAQRFLGRGRGGFRLGYVRPRANNHELISELKEIVLDRVLPSGWLLCCIRAAQTAPPGRPTESPSSSAHTERTPRIEETGQSLDRRKKGKRRIVSGYRPRNLLCRTMQRSTVPCDR